jgi:hypothetical protein
MEPDVNQRVAAALRDVRGLDGSAADRYLRELRRADPEVALRLNALLWAHGTEDRERVATSRDGATPPPTGPDDPAPGSGEQPTGSVDRMSTASFAPPGPVDDGNVLRPPAGPILGRYQLLRVVGRGAFGEVWQAYDPGLQKDVAVKVPRRSGRAVSPTTFLNEARKAASLRHPAIVQVYHVDESANGWYIVSEFIAGASLRARLDAGPLPVDQGARIVATVAGALHAAHRDGLVHRDVKPANILLDRVGNAYLTDFGLAIREDEQFRERSKVAGTMAYMPPEQIRGDTHLLDGRADVYALGAVLYEVLTGRLPFRAETYEEYLELILRREPRPPRSIAAVPEELERICLKCLAKDVKDRYRTAQDLAAELEVWLAGSTRSAEPAPVRPPVRRRSALYGGALGLLVVALGVGVTSAVLDGRSQRPLPEPVPAPAPGPAGAPARTEDQGRKVPRVKELLCRNKAGAFGWEVLPETNELKVYTNTTSLLQVAETTDASWDFSATVQQLGKTWWVGLFLGHRINPRDATASFELVQLVPAGEKVYLQRVIGTYRPGDPVPSPTRSIYGTTAVTPFLQPKGNTIKLIVRNNKLAEVHLNGRAIPELSRATVEPAADGGFGVYNQESDGVYSGLLFKGALIPLLAPAPPAQEKP